MACKPHLLKFTNHVSNLRDRNARQTDKHFVHCHLYDSLIKTLPRCHNRHPADRTALFVCIVNPRRCDIIIPLLALNEIPQKLLCHAVQRNHQHFLGARALPVVFPDRLLKNHMQHIGNPDIQNCKKTIYRARKRIRLLREIQHQHQSHDNNHGVSYCIVKFLIISSCKKVSVGIEKHIVKKAQNDNVCPHHKVKLLGIILVMNDIEPDEQCQSIGDDSAQNIDEQNAVCLYHFVFPSDVLHFNPSNHLPIRYIISRSAFFVKNPGCMPRGNF